MWYSVLNNPNTYSDTTTGDTDNASWTTQYFISGSLITDSQRNFTVGIRRFSIRARMGLCNACHL